MLALAFTDHNDTLLCLCDREEEAKEIPLQLLNPPIAMDLFPVRDTDEKLILSDNLPAVSANGGFASLVDRKSVV